MQSLSFIEMCPLFGVSFKKGSTVIYVTSYSVMHAWERSGLEHLGLGLGQSTYPG